MKGIEKLLKSPACHSLQELHLNNCGMGIGGGKVGRVYVMICLLSGVKTGCDQTLHDQNNAKCIRLCFLIL